MVSPSANSWLDSKQNESENILLLICENIYKFRDSSFMQSTTGGERSHDLCKIEDSFRLQTVYILNVTWKIDIILGKLNRHFEIHVGLALQFDYSLFYIFSVLHFQFFLFLKILPRTLHLQNLTIIGLRVLLSCFLFPNRWDRNIQCHHWFFPLRHEHKERSS